MTDLETLRHSASHVLAAAVKALYPEAKLGIGPAIDDGFYYDIELPVTLTAEDLPKIEKKMQELINQKIPFVKKEVSKKEAIEVMTARKETFKLELLNDFPGTTATLYQNGDFIDLCRGPHVESTGEIKAFKLLSVAGAYWHGIETNPMLTRIYGTAFESKQALDDYLHKLEEAKKRDHRKLGKELDLFSIHYEDAGAGFVYWHPRGAMLRNTIETFLKDENIKRGYQLVTIPHLAKINLFNTSGHTSFYRENMYFMEIDKQEYVIKPMNCPGHILIYKDSLRSYRNLPVKYFEFGTVYRYEKSGVLHGLLRVRGFTQDDAHIFCRFDQLEEQIIEVLEFIDYTLKTFGFPYKINLSTRPEKYAGSLEDWEKAEGILKKTLSDRNLPHIIDPGAGTFYGPKIDIKLNDALNREWQGPTVQVDFNNPERFDLTYVDDKGQRIRPVMIHRAILGSLERFIGALIEHYGGAFPLWLAPVQIMILPISDRHLTYAKSLSDRLKLAGFRVETDESNEKIGKKIAMVQNQKIPYSFIIGDKEIEANAVSVRSRQKGEMGSHSIDAIIEQLKEEVSSRS
jgi:threonyl-tRNA synthetase